MNTLSHFFNDPARQWSRVSPATDAELSELIRSAPCRLPDVYLEFLHHSNGAEGSLGIAPGWCQLWPTSAVVELNEAYALPEFLPGHLAIGSNGGDELFVIPTSGSEPPVLMVPALGMAPAALQPVATTMFEFLVNIGLTQQVPPRA
jgi:hypothetical protein